MIPANVISGDAPEIELCFFRILVSLERLILGHLLFLGHSFA